jgi:Domain of unknown function (DUF3786)
MSYEAAFKKAWEDLANLKAPNNLSVKFMADEYSLDREAGKLLSLSCNTPAKDLLSILILHYLVQKLNGLPELTGQWLTFKELAGIEGYAAAYHQRAIEPLIRKYGNNPDALKNVLNRFPSRLAEGGDVNVAIEAFDKVPVLIKLWKADSEFAPDANIYFDASIKNIFCIEDIIVLAQTVAGQL